MAALSSERSPCGHHHRATSDSLLAAPPSVQRATRPPRDRASPTPIDPSLAGMKPGAPRLASGTWVEEAGAAEEGPTSAPAHPSPLTEQAEGPPPGKPSAHCRAVGLATQYSIFYRTFRTNAPRFRPKKPAPKPKQTAILGGNCPQLTTAHHKPLPKPSFSPKPRK